MKFCINAPIKQSLLALAALVFLGFAAFANSIDNPFLIDDHAFFEEKLKNPKYIWLHFLPDKNRALHIEGGSSDPFYRPISTIVPMIMHLLVRNSVVGFHIGNILLFSIAGWTVFLLARRLGASWFVSMTAAIFYMAHPINGVVVNYITASVFAVQVSLMAGGLMCVWAMVRGRGEDGREKIEEGRMTQRLKSGWSFLSSVFHSLCLMFRRPSSIIHHPSSFVLHSLSILFFTLALMCHETAMAMPIYAFALVAVMGPQTSWWLRLREAWRTTWPLWVVLLFYFVWRMSFSSLEASIIAKIARYDMNFFEYLATWSMLLSWYLSRLFYPDGIVLIMAHQPLKDFWPIVFWIGMLGVLLVLAVWIFVRYRRDPLARFGFLWFALGFAPFTMACFFQPIHGLMIEPHWFLFPVIGFFIFLSRLLESAFLDARWRTAVAVLILVPWLVMTWRHNDVWGDEVRYCTWWLERSPDFVAVNAYLAKAYELRGENDMARMHYRKVLKRGYKTYMAYTNMGLMDMKERKWDSARSNLLKAIAEDAHASVPYSNLGAIEYVDGHYEKALEYFERCKQLDRFAILPRLNISKVYLKLGDHRRAASELEDALNIVPYQEIALVNLIKIYIEQNDRENIFKVARWILERSQNPNALNNVSILFKSGGFDDLSRKAAARAVQLSRP